ncbi:hypothetical protein Asppvi_009841 [Aspergillus pseudoviridinutans]|uniref:Nucleoside phosphorylase domain-containing protein n=1 Tax=Aspergillus pseudoviridinutans TaxID=1517512 RepID=A0A9P3BNE6_9EURO|nr:uncharacterized protein Asppvi_009841 [Aspergillus pseudoviridinutans]GIJ90876.1 hypothetical protein Asppvi_009841 [Aspergillus pseudoviridinutans]
MLFTLPNIRVGLLVGIGPGIPDVDDDPDICLGDIVVGSSSKIGGVIVYDFGKELSDGSFESLSVLNRPPRSLGSALTMLQTQHAMNGNQVMRFVDQILESTPACGTTGTLILAYHLIDSFCLAIIMLVGKLAKDAKHLSKLIESPD